MTDQMQSEVADEVQAFTQVQNVFIDDARVSPAAFRLFVTLKSYTSGRNPSKIAFPSYETIRQKSGIASYATIARAIRELENLGWITRIKRYGRSTLYTLRASPTVSVGLQKVKHQSYKICNSSPTVSVEEQEVEEQEVKEQEVERPRRKLSGFAAVLGEHGDTRVSAYMDILGQKQITETTAALIVKRIDREAFDVWRKVLELWAANSWRASNLSGMFERYDQEKNARRFPKPVPVYASGRGKSITLPQVTDPTPAEFAAAEARAKAQREARR